ncbi:polysaccharide deacetylase family protein [Candidatus Pelagibacter sp.]|nr:polysaccharide deacetylase family protein [Candidatus Pelagibacter sp.]
MKKYFSEFHHGMMFHRFHKNGTRPQGKGSVSEEKFEKIIKFIGIKNILSPEEWIFKLKKKILKKTDVCLTFDDGLRSQFKYALPILKKYNLKAFWFVFSSVYENKIDENELFNQLIFKKFKNTKIFQHKFLRDIKINTKVFKTKKYINYLVQNKKLYPILTQEDIKYRFLRNIYFKRRDLIQIMNKFLDIKKKDHKDAINIWMSKKQLKQISNEGHNIGLHSHSHDLEFKRLSEKKQTKEYKKNFNEIFKITKIKPNAMSHPLNSYNKKTLRILKKLEIICGFRSNLNSFDYINKTDLEIARNDPAYIFKYIN